MAKQTEVVAVVVRKHRSPHGSFTSSKNTWLASRGEGSKNGGGRDSMTTRGQSAGVLGGLAPCQGTVKIAE
jgi:hypothetical protein